MAAVMAKGRTILRNSAREPEIIDLASFLRSMGANIKGDGNDTIEINGVDQLHSSEHTCFPGASKNICFTITVVIS